MTISGRVDLCEVPRAGRVESRDSSNASNARDDARARETRAGKDEVRRTNASRVITIDDKGARDVTRDVKG